MPHAAASVCCHQPCSRLNAPCISQEHKFTPGLPVLSEACRDDAACCRAAQCCAYLRFSMKPPAGPAVGEQL